MLSKRTSTYILLFFYTLTCLTLQASVDLRAIKHHIKNLSNRDVLQRKKHFKKLKRIAHNLRKTSLKTQETNMVINLLVGARTEQKQQAIDVLLDILAQDMTDEQLIELLKQAENLRWFAIKYLGIRGEKKHAHYIAIIMINDPSLFVRQQAIQAIIDIGAYKRSINPLIDVLNNKRGYREEEAYQRANAANALAKIASKLQIELITGKPSLDEPVIRGMLEQIHHAFVDVLDDHEECVQKSSIAGLAPLILTQAEIVDTLIIDLNKQKNDDVRICIIQALGKLGPDLELHKKGLNIEQTITKVVQGLVQVMHNSAFSKQVRIRATEALGNLGQKSALQSLIKTLQNNMDNELGIFAAESLGKLRDIRALKPLMNTWGHEEVFWYAVDAIGKLPHESNKVRLALQKAKQHPNKEIALTAAEVLSNFQNRYMIFRGSILL